MHSGAGDGGDSALSSKRQKAALLLLLKDLTCGAGAGCWRNGPFSVHMVGLAERVYGFFSCFG